MSEHVYQNDVTAWLISSLQREHKVIRVDTSVLIIYTGGTIGMVNLGEGYVPQPGAFQQLLRGNIRFHDEEEYQSRLQTPNFKPEFMITPRTFYGKRIIYELKEMSPLLDSSCMDQRNWIDIAKFIEENYSAYDAFVILHGTDTMPYTASILSFLLENLSKPVIITGSQVPMREMRNDAHDNLMGALTIAGHFDIPEVSVYFGNKLYRGNRTVKLDNSQFEAFTSPNLRPLATVGIKLDVAWELIRKPGHGAFRVQTQVDSNISVVRFFPGIPANALRAACEPPTRGVLLQTFGSGNIPDNRPEILEILKQANDRGIVLVNVSQCIKGGVSATYHCGTILSSAGVVSGSDMTTECAICKLSYLLGKDFTVPEIKLLMERNLRGELSQSGNMQFSPVSSDFVRNLATSLGLETTEDSTAIFDSLMPTLMCSAARAGRIPVMSLLHKNGARLHSQDHEMRSPMHIAACYGQKDVIAYLLEHGAPLDPLDFNGETPLFQAIQRQHFDIAELLRGKGATIRATNEVLITALNK